MNKILRLLWALALSGTLLLGCDNDSDVIGLNDAAKYGNIQLTLEGIRSDGVAFTQKMNYRFLAEERYESSTVEYENERYYFEVQRQHGAVNDNHNENYAYIYLVVDSVTNVPITDGANSYFGLETTIADQEDVVYFDLFTGAYFNVNEINSYSYNAGSGKLTLKFTKILDADSNQTNHELKVTGTMNVTVFELLNSYPN